MTDCIFCKIRDGEIPAEIIYRDEHCLAFKDIHPAAPVHVVIIPSKHVATLNDIGPAQGDAIAHLLQAVGKVATQLGVAETGYRIVVNCNKDGGQEVFHLHFHLLGGRGMGWPPG
ncbi:MAG: histidine triad nucleotide-binding protein [Deltaproteobacteria bacterium]|nr:histidine triad nucleotide-binding protein [Deltaproteobacteria bacterium]